MIPFLALVLKDLKLFFTDRRAVVLGVLVPIACASFFGYLFGGGRGRIETTKVPIILVDQDDTEISRALVTSLGGDKNLDVKTSTIDVARDLVRSGKATAAIVIPKDFGRAAGRAILTGVNKPELSLLYDPSHGIELSMVKGVLSGSVMQTVSKEMFTGKMGQEMVDESLASLDATDMPSADREALHRMLDGVKTWNDQRASGNVSGQGNGGGGLTLPYRTQDEAITSGRDVEYNSYAHSFGGMGVQFILFVGLDVGIALLIARKSGLWQRLRAAPLSRLMLLGSRLLSAALMSGFILIVLFSFARIVFGVHILGSFAGFVGVCAAFSLMTAAFGLMIAALGETVEATRAFSIMATIVMVMLGGAWVPTFLFPEWLQRLTVVIPTRWAIDGLDAMTWRGLGFSSALAPIAVLLLFTLLFGGLAMVRFRW
jgi:ABC-2 type transport system permease protein